MYHLGENNFCQGTAHGQGLAPHGQGHQMFRDKIAQNSVNMYDERKPVGWPKTIRAYLNERHYEMRSLLYWPGTSRQKTTITQRRIVDLRDTQWCTQDIGFDPLSLSSCGRFWISIFKATLGSTSTSRRIRTGRMSGSVWYSLLRPRPCRGASRCTASFVSRSRRTS